MLHIENRIIPAGKNYLGEIARDKRTYINILESSDGLEPSPANRTIEYYENQLLNPPVGRENIGYHFMVSDDRIVQFIPLKFRTAHAGSTEGNNGIGIVRLVSCVTDQIEAIENQALLVATLMKAFDIPLEQVVPHKHWSGKERPSRLLAGMYGGWDYFINLVDDFYSSHLHFNISELN